MRYVFFFFFFNDTATTEIYTLSLHDALPILVRRGRAAARDGRHRQLAPLQPCSSRAGDGRGPRGPRGGGVRGRLGDRKSTRLNSSHANISYAVFCLKKKKKF